MRGGDGSVPAAGGGDWGTAGAGWIAVPGVIGGPVSTPPSPANIVQSLPLIGLRSGLRRSGFAKVSVLNVTSLLKSSFD